MEQTTQNNRLPSLLIFIIVGALLLATVTLGMWWARSRSDHFATASNTQQPTAAPAYTNEQKKPEDKKTTNQPQQTTQPSQTQPQTTQNRPNTTGQTAPSNPAPQANAASPAQVPTTGIEDIFLAIGALSAVVFAAITYIQSRRRLARIH